MHELHVAADHCGDVVDHMVRVAQAAEDRDGHFRAEGVVAVEADAPVLIDGAGGRFGDVVKQRGEAEFERRVVGEHVEHDHRVDEDIALGMEFRRLIAADGVQQLRQEVFDQPGVHEVLHSLAAARAGEDAREFVADALGRDPVQQRRAIAQRGVGGRIDAETKPGGEAHTAQQAQPVLVEARGGLADGADDAGLEIRESADVVDDFAVRRVFEQAVDGEIAASSVFLGRGEGDALRPPSIAVAAVGAEGGDLDMMAAVSGDDHAEVRADLVGAGKHRGHFRWRGGGGDVVVLGLVAQQAVPHAAAGKQGLVPG